MSGGVGCRHGSDLVLLRLWCRPTAWEYPYTMGSALKSQKKSLGIWALTRSLLSQNCSQTENQQWHCYIDRTTRTHVDNPCIQHHTVDTCRHRDAKTHWLTPAPTDKAVFSHTHTDTQFLIHMCTHTHTHTHITHTPHTQILRLKLIKRSWWHEDHCLWGLCCYENQIKDSVKSKSYQRRFLVNTGKCKVVILYFN